MSDRDFNTFEMYKLAIEGRNEHYKNYNAWVNLYSIFTGALFVGYYSVLDKNNSFISLIIAIAGLVASLCWYLSVMGYYSWMVSWISVVQDYEERLNNEALPSGNIKESKYVYSVHIDKHKKYDYVSTQKVTKFFVRFLSLLWNVIIFKTLWDCKYGFLKDFCISCLECQMISKLISFAIMLILILLEFAFIKLFRVTHFLSYVNKMKRSIYE